jgi:hypothetical protein
MQASNSSGCRNDIALQGDGYSLVCLRSPDPTLGKAPLSIKARRQSDVKNFTKLYISPWSQVETRQHSKAKKYV